MSKDDDMRPLSQEELDKLFPELAQKDPEPVNFGLPPVPNKDLPPVPVQKAIEIKPNEEVNSYPTAIAIETKEDAISQQQGIDIDKIAYDLVANHLDPLIADYETHEDKGETPSIKDITSRMQNMTQAMVDEKIITQEQRDEYIKPSKSWGEFFTFAEGTAPSKLENDIKSSLKFDKDSNLKYEEVHLFKDKVKKMVSAICSYLCPDYAKDLLNSIDDPALRKRHAMGNDLSGLLTKVEKGIKRKAPKAHSKEVGSKVKKVLAERQKTELTTSKER